jgi:hypothetical protein
MMQGVTQMLNYEFNDHLPLKKVGQSYILIIGKSVKYVNVLLQEVKNLQMKIMEINWIFGANIMLYG